MKKTISYCLLMFVTLINAQTITFKGCIPLFEDQEYVFTQTGTDGTGRNIYITTPADGAQNCGGLGVCEFKIQWSVANNRWEFLADDNDGSFATTNLIFYNTSASTSNPPSLALGSWIENSTVTSGGCGGNLTPNNATMTGGVQDTVLGNDQFVLENSIVVYPNPTTHTLKIEYKDEISNVTIWNIKGQRVLSFAKTNILDVSTLETGTYFARIQTAAGLKVASFIKK
jgi:hypothetical protein